MDPKLHLFEQDISGIDLPERLNCPFNYKPHPLAVLAAEQVRAYVATHPEWQDELQTGKMLGVLLVSSDNFSRRLPLTTADFPLTNIPRRGLTASKKPHKTPHSPQRSEENVGYREAPPQCYFEEVEPPKILKDPHEVKAPGVKSYSASSASSARDKTPRGEIGFLAAFSGNLAGAVNHDYFVPPIFDLLAPHGDFKRGEAVIDALTLKIRAAENDTRLSTLNAQLSKLKEQHRREEQAFHETMRRHKAQRDARRQAAALTDDEAEQLLNQSRFEKAELRRIRRAHTDAEEELQRQIQTLTSHIASLKKERRERSEELQRHIFRQFVVTNARGEKRDLVEVFATLGSLPPAGAGECCAPRLLNYAFTHGMRPLALAEFWYGKSPQGEVRHHGHFYPACRSKCKPILDFMLIGVDVEPNPAELPTDAQPLKELYDDPWLTVVEKPAGLLSVPGKQQSDSALTRWQAAHPEAHGPMVVHRLDQETSGILIFAKDKKTHYALQQQFANRTVEKTYLALVEGDVTADRGIIDLPLTADITDRPRQKVDFNDGAPAQTRYEVLERHSDGTTLVAFHPLTGRTHQIRVHASHQLGLNAPIVGDRLYGNAANRLMLHAATLTFTHPTTNKPITITSHPNFN